jgi:hypothetical protein
MVFVVFAVQIPERAMKRAMLGTTMEALFMRTPVSFRELVVELPMPSATVVSVVVVVRESLRRWRRYRQRCRGGQNFADGHDTSPVRLRLGGFCGRSYFLGDVSLPI